MSFINDINKVLKKHSRSAAELALAFPESKAAAAPKTRRSRKSPPLRTFKHPKTGEIIKAKRTNNKTLRGWATELKKDVDSFEVK